MDFLPCFTNEGSAICERYIENCKNIELCKLSTHELKGSCKCKFKSLCNLTRQETQSHAKQDGTDKCAYYKINTMINKEREENEM